MIKTSDLMIDNLVSFGNEIFSVGGIVNRKILITGMWVDVDMLTPIPLTAEILEVCGFKMIKFDHQYFTETAYFLANMLIYIHKPNAIEIEYAPDWCKFEYRSHIVGKSIVGSLHQLQNLYFSLTGQHLEIDINKLNK